MARTSRIDANIVTNRHSPPRAGYPLPERHLLLDTEIAYKCHCHEMARTSRISANIVTNRHSPPRAGYPLPERHLPQDTEITYKCHCHEMARTSRAMTWSSKVSAHADAPLPSHGRYYVSGQRDEAFDHRWIGAKEAGVIRLFFCPIKYPASAPFCMNTCHSGSACIAARRAARSAASL